MAEGFAFASGVFQTRDTTRYRRYANARRREKILAQRSMVTSPTDPEEEMEQEMEGELSLSQEVSRSYRIEVPEEKEVESTKGMDGLCSPGPRRWAYKNLYGVSIAFMLVFSAFIGIQNLQSSLNAQLGLVSLSVTYGFFFLIGFATPGIVRFLGTKYALLFGFICHVVYIASNFYPEYYTLVPSSILLGIGSGPVWAGLSTHIATVAITLAPHVSESIDIVISKFTGTFFFIFQLTQLFGNLVSSLVLFPYGESNNDTTPDVCDNTEAADVEPALKYVLLAIYLAFDIAGITVLLIVVNRLTTDFEFSSRAKVVRKYCTQPFIDLLKVLFSWKMLLLGPLSLYNGLELSFAFGSFTQAFISECVGVSKVGFALIVLGLFSAGTSFFYGKVVKYVPRIFLTTTAATINTFFYVFLLIWTRKPSFELIFIFPIFWGVADGIWNTMSASLVGILYPEDQEAAYSAFRIWMSLGFAFGFGLAQIDEVDYRLITLLCILIFSYTLYVLLEFFISRFGAKCCKRKEETMTIDEGLKEKMLGDKNSVLNKQGAMETNVYTLYAEEQ